VCASRHQEWLKHHERHFDGLDEHVKGRALSFCRDSFETKHNRGDISSPTFCAITLSEFRQFAVRVKQRFQEDCWNRELLEKRKRDNRKIIAKLAERWPNHYFEHSWILERQDETKTAIREEIGSSGSGEYCGNETCDWTGSWETLTWYHVKHLMFLEEVFNAGLMTRSYVQTLPGKKALRGQFHFTFGWMTPFAELIDGIEWLAEVRGLSDTTPIVIYPLTHDIASRREYYDGKLWESCMKVCDCSVIFGDKLCNAGPLLDIYNAISQRKSIDLMCGTGLLALVRLFEAGKTWEFGRFEYQISTYLRQYGCRTLSVLHFCPFFFNRISDSLLFKHVLKKEMGNTDKLRLALMAAQFKANNNRNNAGVGSNYTAGGSPAREIRGLLDGDDYDTMELALRKHL
jgi:hypothetical protein